MYTRMHMYAYMYTCIDTQVHFELIPAGSAWVQQGGGNDVSNAVTSKANGFTSTAGDAGPGLTSACERFFWPEWDSSAFAAPLVPVRAQVRAALKAAVHRRMMSHVPFGALLSGGVDSCIVTSLMVEIAREQSLTYNWPDGRLRTYTVGMEGSPDVMAARAMARHLDSVHTERL